jgi:hypothetical protein
MAKQQITETTPSAREIFEKINAKLPELREQRSALAAEAAKIERVNRAGVPAVFATEPPDESRDIESPAYELLNGASIAALPSKRGGEPVRLYAIQHELRIVDRAIKIAESQVLTASVAAARESSAAGLDQTNALHRQRALLLVSLLHLNETIEAHRISTAVGGVCADGPLEGFTARLFGTGTVRSPLNHWPHHYLEACLAAGVITKKDLTA